MSIEQVVIERFRELSPDKQQQVLDFVESLVVRANGYQDKIAKGQGKTAFEAARKYAGSLEGPEDLSTNPKYMEGFGQ